MSRKEDDAAVGCIAVSATRAAYRAAGHRAGVTTSDGEGKIKGGGTHGRVVPPAAGGTLPATPAPMAHHTAIGATIAPYGRAGTVAPTFSERSE